ncbi:hypothetical protein NLU13_3647 [Sarocladium strictum]|uniref:Uncharacterized protein n=1 Tax=Sarocladium strictum TaxID=5046 RepID=A0AA39GN65_SARSR|nr:hypothetical protein NLU13_3647 [Sarocladium strictum]
MGKVLVMYPLDVVKTRLQLQRSGGGNPQYSGMMQCFSKILKEDGLSRFYRGITAPILMETPKRATKFAANDLWSRLYGELLGNGTNSQSLAVLTGASTGATEALVVVPFELVKIRLQDPRSSLQYRGIVDCAAQIARESGPLGLYRGFESTVWRHIVWNAGYFGCIFKVRSLLGRYSAGKSGGGMMDDFVAGSIGGTVATVLNTPLDVVKSRIQSVAPDARGKARIPWIVRFAPGGGMMLVVYTSVIEFLAS